MKGSLLSIHHIEFYVSNALQASHWYCINFGFQRFAKKQTKQWTSIAIRSGNIILIFTTCKERDEDFIKHLCTHGDSVKDVAFLVEDIGAAVEQVVGGGGFLARPMEVIGDDDGFLKSAVVGLPECDILHTLLNPKTYHGFFLPNYEHYDDNCDLLKSLEEIPFRSVDHFVMNFPNGFLKNAQHFYYRTLGLEEIWSADESVCGTEHSAMKVSLLANKSRTIQLTLAEPVPKALRVRDQIQEFLDYNGGTGVQHIAFLVDDIIGTVEKMKRRDVKFIPISNEYYIKLEERLAASPIKLEQDFNKIKQLKILMDFDHHGYLLQAFTRPVQDRPTLFFEIIQRKNFFGFGAGNVKALFDAIEKEQDKRGTLYQDY